MAGLDYWFDGQFRRYLTHIQAIFSGIQWQSGVQSDGTTYMRTVPVKWAAPDRQVDTIIRNNSENTLLSVPCISVWISGLEMDDSRRLDPSFVDHRQVVERKLDPITNQYTNVEGNRYTVERYMPVPYLMRIQIDIWTSNQLQKDQILEQLLILFNPSLDLQTSTNPLDWTALTIITLKNITMSSRNIPIGAGDDIDIATLEFEVPILLSPPAKIKKQNIINQIIANMGTIEDMPKYNPGDYYGGTFWSENDLLARVIITPGDYCIDVTGNLITILSEDGLKYDSSGNILSWKNIIDKYGEFRPNISQIRLKANDNPEDFKNDLVGVVDFHPTLQNVLIWTVDVDTLKGNTIKSINMAIDPQMSAPGKGLDLPVNGQRYLLMKQLLPNEFWGLQTVGNIGDIIEYSNGTWFRTFIAENSTSIQYVTNLYSGQQLKWDVEDNEWIMSIDGVYNPGYWRLFL